MVERFRALVDDTLTAYFDRYPTHASALGLHAYDGRVTDYRPAAIDAWLTRVKNAQAALAEIDADALPPDDQLDHAVLDLALERELYEWDELSSWRRNPMDYLWSADVSHYLKRAYAPLPRRALAVAEHLEAVPALLAQGQDNLSSVLPETFIDTALDMARGLTGFLTDELSPAVAAVAAEEAALHARVMEARTAATRALEDYILDLEGRRAGATDDFAIGARLFRRMLWTGEAVDVPLHRLLELAEADLAKNRSALEATALGIDPDRTPAELLAAMRADHPSRETLVDETAAMLEDLRSWVMEHALLTIPSDVRAEVAETPSFMRWAFAMMDTPGPFEEVATEAYYYVTPPEDDWPPEQQEAWLTKFDYATLRDVSIHETYPGHYVHYLHFREVPSRVRRVFGAYSFWEAWAHYVEQMMVEAGYRSDDLELRLAQLSEALLRDCRFIAAIKMHTQGMTVDEATTLFMTQAYMAEKTARQEAVRGTFDPGYLNYTLGKLMLLKLREDYKAKCAVADEPFSLRRFHDAFLSYGAPPVPLVRRAMLGPDAGPAL